MDTVLGLFGIALWIVAVIALAAAITLAVIRLSPGEREEKSKPAEGA